MQLPICDTLLLNVEASTLFVTLNRPHARNALTVEVINELNNVIDTLEPARDIRAVVLRGADGTFCAGGDIKRFEHDASTPASPSGAPDPIATDNRKVGEFFQRFEQLPQVTIGIIEGAAFGGGLGLVCITDVAICREDARFALSETGLGIPPAQIAAFVVRRVGWTNARHIALTGARFDGRYAKEIGLVHRLVKDEHETEAVLTQVLKDIQRCAPGANAATKQIMSSVGVRALADVLDDASRSFADCLRGPEGQEGVAAFVEKRKPTWAKN